MCIASHPALSFQMISTKCFEIDVCMIASSKFMIEIHMSMKTEKRCQGCFTSHSKIYLK